MKAIVPAMQSGGNYHKVRVPYVKMQNPASTAWPTYWIPTFYHLVAEPGH